MTNPRKRSRDTPSLGTPAVVAASGRQQRGKGLSPQEERLAVRSSPDANNAPSSPPPEGSRASNRGRFAPSSVPPGSSRPHSSGRFPLARPPDSGPRTSPSSSPPGRKVDFGLITPATRVIEELLCVETNDRIVIVHDDTNEEVAMAFEDAATSKGTHIERLQWGPQHARPLVHCPPNLLWILPGASATVLAVTLEDGEYDARHAFVRAAAAARTRHIHMVGTSRAAFVASMMTSTSRVFDLLDALRTNMRTASRLLARNTAGTNLLVETAPHLRWSANGNVARPGLWSNVPFGALVSSPASATGTFVADAAMSGGVGARAGLLKNRPIQLTIEAGRVKRVDCRDITLKRYVESFIQDGPGHDRIGLISLGANVGILSPIGEIVHDEVMPGLHISLGDPIPSRTGATWTAHGQLSFAEAYSDVDLDDDPLIRHGRYVRLV